MIKLVGFDLDGTLLSADKEITARTNRILRMCARKHIVLVPVTGRPFSGIPHELLSMDFIHFAISSNGSVTGRVPSGEPVRSDLMAAETVQNVLSAADEASGGDEFIAEVFTGGRGYHDPASDMLIKAKYRSRPQLLAYFRASRVTVPSLSGFVPGRKFENISLMFKEKERRARCEEILRNVPGIRVIVPAAADLEIVCERADKGKALLALAADLHIPRSDIMAAGDGSNDRELLACAGISVAMGNAREDLRRMADYVAPDNEHDGLAQALEHFILEK